MVSPFAQGTSSENNVGDRVRTFQARFFNSSSASFHFDRSRCLLLARCLLNEPLLPARPLSLILSKVKKKRRGTTAQWCFYESTELCVTVATRPQGRYLLLLLRWLVKCFLEERQRQRKKRSLLYSRSRNSGAETATLRMRGVLHYFKQNSTILVQSSTSLMGSRQDKQPASLPQLLKEQDEIMLLWNVFWRGFEIKPISFYLKQCAICLQFNKHTLARIVLRFPSLFSWDIIHHSGISPLLNYVGGGCPWMSLGPILHRIRELEEQLVTSEGRNPKERRNQSSQAWISRFTCEGTSERLPGIRKKESRARQGLL
ncbi:hypothetical protein QVD17_42477 [Tagetes erecta]|uniref:Uncharacterized protein n=1 Tax=Tagetes erecta TaxID=13708 RepID=A0AAD8JJW9_TARER|nr:hypothetical protein QVD17_42477 [Tagetes erecta]